MNILVQVSRRLRKGFGLNALAKRNPLHIVVAAATLGLLAVSPAAFAQGNPFAAGDLVVTRVGDGSVALTSAATAVFLDEYNRMTGALVQSIALPTAANGSNNPFTNSGTATSEGALALSADGRYLTLAGYKATLPTANIAGTTSAANPRVIARVDLNGNVDTTTSTTNAFSGNNIRGAVTTNGSNFYSVGGNSGVQNSPTLGSTTTSPTSTTSANNRVINIFSDQLYFSSGAGTRGIYTLGSDTSPASTATLLLATGQSSSPYDFYLSSDQLTLYVADDAAGLQKYTRPTSTGTFTLVYTATAAGTTGFRGLAVSGNQLYATSAVSSGLNGIFSIVDNNEKFSTPTLIATAATNTAIRGLEIIPDVAAVPESGTLISLSLGLLMLGGAGLRARRTHKTNPNSVQN